MLDPLSSAPGLVVSGRAATPQVPVGSSQRAPSVQPAAVVAAPDPSLHPNSPAASARVGSKSDGSLFKAQLIASGDSGGPTATGAAASGGSGNDAAAQTSPEERARQAEEERERQQIQLHEALAGNGLVDAPEVELFAELSGLDAADVRAAVASAIPGSLDLPIIPLQHPVTTAQQASTESAQEGALSLQGSTALMHLDLVT